MALIVSTEFRTCVIAQKILDRKDTCAVKQSCTESSWVGSKPGNNLTEQTKHFPYLSKDNSGSEKMKSWRTDRGQETNLTTLEAAT